MKTPILLFLIISFIPLHSFSQKIDREAIAYYQSRVESGKNTKKIGNSLFIPGGVILVTGIAMIASAEYDRDANGMLVINDPTTSLGVALALNGLPMTVIGGIMSLVGNSQVKRAEKQLEKLSFSYYQKSSYRGFGVTYNF